MHKGAILTHRFIRVLGITGVYAILLQASAQEKGIIPPNAQDCLGALPVCQPVYTTTNSYIGCGNVCPEIHNNSLCPLCMDGELNDVFYVLTVQTSGILRFILTPNNPNNDYDWSVFNMTNADCSQLYPQAVALQVSCNSYGNLGYNGPTGINTSMGNNSNCNGPGLTNGPPFNKDLTVLAGQTYLINISNWSSTSQSGYTLDFSGSTASIFDNVPPAIDSIQEEIPCSGSAQLFIRFTENVLCSDVFHHEEKFSLSGPSGPVTITDVTSSDCTTGANQSPIYTLQLGETVTAGSYTLSIIGEIRDLCANAAQYDSYPFTLTGINAPVANAGNDTTIANGVIITLNGSATGGTQPLAYHWEPASLLLNPNVPDPTTINMGASTIFTLSVTDGLGCIDSDDVLITVVGGPLEVTASAAPGVLCHGSSSQLNAFGSGGSGNYTYSWNSSPAGFTSTLPNPVVYPSVTTTYTVVITDGFSTNSDNAVVTVNPNPAANAGPDVSIPYGATTILHGSASGGSGSYQWFWTSNPPGFSSGLQNPVTNNLEVTTLFTLVATDQVTGCQSPADEVIVTVTGSPLSAAPIALPPILCQGVSTQLFSMASGGTGNYTYAWSSVPAGFTSSEANPWITPSGTTAYYVTVHDGFNQAGGNVNVVVNPVPLIHLGPPDTMVCIYDTITLNAGNPGSAYYWSNGATTQTIRAGTTGIGYDIQHYSVKVINQYACMDSSGITLIFSFAACTGLDDEVLGMKVGLFPNPTAGTLHLSMKQVSGEVSVTLFSIYGQVLMQENLHTTQPESFYGTYDLSEFPKGAYLLRIIRDRQTAVRKVILN